MTFEAASNATQPEPMLLKAVGALGLRHMEDVGSGQLLRALEHRKAKLRRSKPSISTQNAREPS